MKEKLVWINECNNPLEFTEALEEWVKRYNNEYLHSALQYQTPMAFEQQLSAYRTQLQTAWKMGRITILVGHWPEYIEGVKFVHGNKTEDAT